MQFLTTSAICTAAAVAVGFRLNSIVAALAIWIVCGCLLIWLASNEKTE